MKDDALPTTARGTSATADVSDGTGQEERAQPALAPGYVEVDDRSLEELLRLLRGVAANLAWFDQENRRIPEGWEDLYLQNDLGVLADMASLDVAALKRGAQAAARRGDRGGQAEEVFRIAERIDGWYRVLRRSEYPTVAALGASLRRIIEADLGPALRVVWGREGVGEAAGVGTLPQGDPVDFSGFEGIWGMARGALAAPREEGDPGPSPMDPDAALARAREILLNTCAYLASAGREGQESVLRSGRNDPAFGLIVAFLQLFIRARGELNAFPRRRLDFYYRDVLGMKPRGRVPDHAHLLLRAAPGVGLLQLPAGTEFSAGSDPDQREMVYATREAVALTDARVVALRVLEYERDPLISPERELGFVTRVLGASAEDPAPGLESGEPSGVFGGPAGGTHLSPAGVAMGFAVASPVLALASGTRRLTFDILLGDPVGEAGSTLDSAIAALGEVGPGETDRFFRRFGRIVVRALLQRPGPGPGPGIPEDSWCTLAQRDGIRARARVVLGKELDTLMGMAGSRLTPEQREAIRTVATSVGESEQEGRLEAVRRRFPAPWSVSEEEHDGLLDGILAASPARISRDQEEMLRFTVGELRASLGVLEHALTADPLSLLDRLFADALTVRFTGARGWEEVQGIHVGLPEGMEGGGLRVGMTLGPQVGPVVPFDPALHGTHFDGTTPIVGFRLNPQAVFHPFSFLDCLALLRIDVQVEVQGAVDLVVQNGLGPLDPSRPFLPFGPLPTRESYLVVGSFEAAAKSLVDASLEVEWGGLPDLPGGLRQHYAGYHQDITNEAFRTRVSLLRDGRWEPADPALATVVPLFENRGDGGATAHTVRIPLGPMTLFKPVPPGTPGDRFASMLHARQGLFRLSLEASDVTFGHAEYPRLLTEVLSRNVRSRRPEPLPNPPYTPLVNRITLDYTARATLFPERREGAAGAGPVLDRILHEHPFGVEDLAATVDEKVHTLMPGRPLAPGEAGEPRDREGYLFLGVKASALPGALSLLFHLRHDALQDPVVEDPGVTWFYLRSNRWHPLASSRVMGDTTSGFQRSGIVTLDIPEDIDAESTILPRGLFWLAVGVNRRIRSLVSRLLVASAGGVEVVWQDRGNLRQVEVGLPAGSIKEGRTRVPGLASVLQVGGTFGGRGAEDDDGLVTRTAERLRHRKRAVSAWDYERLVLDRFPELYQVKVLPHTDTRYHGPRPGSVLVVVVPRLDSQEGIGTLTPRFSGGDLIDIRDYLQSLSPGSARVYVQNPVYEQIQVRCTVKLARGTPPGLSLRTLGEILVEHLSPWRPGGYGLRFGWRIRRKDVEARIRAVPWVEAVTGFSMLQITLDPRGRYRLDDTARPGEAGGGDRDGRVTTSTLELSARYPWSLAVPMNRHAIETTAGDVEIEARVTGVGSLEVGTNFILDAGHRHG